MKIALAVLVLSTVSFASIGKVISFPARHPKVSAHHVKKIAQHVGHIVKVVLY